MRIEPLGSAALMLRIEAGERIPDVLLAWVKTQPFRAAAVQGIGAVAEAEIGFFDPETRRYEKIHLPEQMEVLSLLGNLSLDPQGAPFFHLHVVLGRPDGSTLGGICSMLWRGPRWKSCSRPCPVCCAGHRTRILGLTCWIWGRSSGWRRTADLGEVHRWHPRNR